MIPILFFCLGASLGSFMGVIWDSSLKTQLFGRQVIVTTVSIH